MLLSEKIWTFGSTRRRFPKSGRRHLTLAAKKEAGKGHQVSGRFLTELKHTDGVTQERRFPYWSGSLLFIR